MLSWNHMKQLESDAQVLVIGDIHEQEKEFDLLIQKFSPGPKRYIVSVGDIYDKGAGIEVGHSITRKLIKMSEDNYCFVIRGNHEAKKIKENFNFGWKKYHKKDTTPNELKWFAKQPLYLNLKIDNFNLLVVHGGLLPKMKKIEDLDEDVMYVRDIDPLTGKKLSLVWKTIAGTQQYVPCREGGVSWHELYDGRFGYVASGHDAQRDGKAKFYCHSCNLDSCCYGTGVLTGAVFDAEGLKETIEVKLT